MLEHKYPNPIILCFITKYWSHIFYILLMIQKPKCKTLNILNFSSIEVVLALLMGVPAIFNIDLVDLFELISFNTLGEPESSVPVADFGQ